MKLMLVNGNEASCVLCSWTRRFKDKNDIEKAVLEHLRLLHDRLLISKEEGKRAGSCSYHGRRIPIDKFA